MKTVLLREIDVKVVRVNPRGECSPSPEYVFAIRPRSKSLQGSQAPRRQDLDAATLDQKNVAVVHEVPHTYSECRSLYQELQQLTDCKNVRACGCALGSCPFWSLFGVLCGVDFPKRTLFNHQSKTVFAHRTLALDALMKAILAMLRNTYRIRHFRCYQAPFDAPRVCKVLVAFCLFFELDRSDVEQKLLEGGQRHAYKLNLQGWQSDRPNLYFYCEDKSKYRDAGAVQQPKSLAISDDDKDPTCIMSDEEDDQRRSSLVLVWS